MDKNDLFNAINEIDDDIIERSETPKSYKKPIWVRFAAIAACLCVLITASVIGFLTTNAPDEDVSEDVPAQKGSPTSEKYSNLRQLIEDLRDKEEHNTLGSSAANGGESSDVTKPSSVVAYKNFVYEILHEYKNNRLLLWRLGSENPNFQEERKETDIPASSLLIYNDKLIVISKSAASIYSLADPANPKLMTSYTTQNCAWTAVYTYKENLYIITSDGVCACGFSRTDDMSEYYPNLAKDGKSVPWGDEDISILGEPTKIIYAAMTKINLDTLEIVNKQAFYGDVWEVFFGPDWFAVETKPLINDYFAIPDVYTFNTSDGIEFTGKIDIPKIAGYKRLVPDSEDKDLFWMNSMDCVDGIYRIIGKDYSRMWNSEKRDYDYSSANIVTITYDSNTKKHSLNKTSVLAETNNSYVSIDEILWEKDRAIVSLEIDFGYVRFFFIEFSGINVTVYKNELTNDYRLLSSDKESSFIPLPNGIYLRFGEGNRSLDIYDFSDSSSPKWLNSANFNENEGVYEKDCRLLNAWWIYSDNTFGILYRQPYESEYGESENEYWRIYSVDPTAETPFTLISEDMVFFSEDYGFKTFEHEGNLYISDRYRLEILPASVE